MSGSVRRAEVLLNAEYLTALLRERSQHIKQYEDVFARKVHQRAEYLRKLQAYEKGRRLIRPTEPVEPTKVITVIREGEDLGNFFIKSETRVKDAITREALPYHYEEISRLNKCIEEEFIRLAREQRRKVEKVQESRVSKWLGLRHIRNTDTGRVRSSTAFVEFKSMVAKQAAIQCNITGTCGLLEIEPVPGKCQKPIWYLLHLNLKVRVVH
jgi:hypothetical protein